MLIYDVRDNKWTTAGGGSYKSAWYHYDTGKLAVLNDGIIKTLQGGEDYAPYIYQTGPITMGTPELKSFDEIEIHGEGTAHVTVYIDGESVGEKIVDMDGMLRDRRMYIPKGKEGRTFAFQLSGTAEVYEVTTNASPVQRPK